jgi:hypothetical protein
MSAPAPAPLPAVQPRIPRLVGRHMLRDRFHRYGALSLFRRTDGTAANAALPLKVWRLFAQDAGPLHIPERFDHRAGHGFAFAEDPPVTLDQKRKIYRLLFRRKMLVSSPLVTSWEEQDPFYGRWVLSTLCYGKYGDFKIINNNHPRLNNPPSTLPPKTAHIHLCWGIGFAGVAQASALQTMVALLLDDWRDALQRFRCRFFLDRLSPLPRTVDAGFAGTRWRDLKSHSLPPARVIGSCFLRANYADLAVAGEWSISGNAVAALSWRCAFLLECDLPDLGFRPAVSYGLAGPAAEGWVAEGPSRLPAGIDHVIVVPPEEGPGQFLKVVSSGEEKRLEPVRRRPYAITDKDYWRLRVVALDLLLEELWARSA